jgi:hypothetical protein
MPSFLKEFRRRSKASFKNDKAGSGNDGHSHSSSNDSRSHDGTTVEPVPGMPRNKSSSTLNSVFGGRSPPLPTGSPPLPSLQSVSSSNTNLAGMNGSKTPPLGSRPAPSNNNSSRYSIAVSRHTTISWLYKTDKRPGLGQWLTKALPAVHISPGSSCHLGVRGLLGTPESPPHIRPGW